MLAANSNEEPYAISRHSDLSLLRTPRERGDRRYVELQRSAPIKSYATECLRGLGIAAFVLIVFVGLAVI